MQLLSALSTSLSSDFVLSNLLHDCKLVSAKVSDVSNWTQVLISVQALLHNTPAYKSPIWTAKLHELKLGVARMARKSHNFNQAQRQLFGLVPLDSSLISTDPSLLSFAYEKAKLDFDGKDYTESISSLCRLGFESIVRVVSGECDVDSLHAKVLIRLAKWIDVDEVPLTIVETNFQKFRSLPAALTLPLWLNSWDLSVRDRFSGLALHSAVELCPELSKAYFTYAAWSFRLARKSFDVEGKLNLTLNEKGKIRDILLSAKISKETEETVVGILSTTRYSSQPGIDKSDSIDYDDDIVEDPDDQDARGLRAYIA